MIFVFICVGFYKVCSCFWEWFWEFLDLVKEEVELGIIRISWDMFIWCIVIFMWSVVIVSFFRVGMVFGNSFRFDCDGFFSVGIYKVGLEECYR